MPRTGSGLTAGTVHQSIEVPGTDRDPRVDGDGWFPSSGSVGRLARGWRALRTGLAFGTFGAGALVVTLVAFPILRLLPSSRASGEQRAQYVVHLAFRLFAWFMEALGLIRVTRIGTARLRSRVPMLVVANHPTLIDVVLLIACMPQADCVVKRRAWSNRFLRGVLAGAGYIPNDEGPLLIDACVQRLRAGRSVLLFPEGTRSPVGGLGSFRRGAARIAFASRCDLVPVVITCDPPTLMKGKKWYHVPDRTAHLVLTVEEPMAASGYRGIASSDSRAVRQLTADLRRLFLKRLGLGESDVPGVRASGVAAPGG